MANDNNLLELTYKQLVIRIVCGSSLKFISRKTLDYVTHIHKLSKLNKYWHSLKSFRMPCIVHVA